MPQERHLRVTRERRRRGAETAFIPIPLPIFILRLEQFNQQPIAVVDALTRILRFRDGGMVFGFVLDDLGVALDPDGALDFFEDHTQTDDGAEGEEPVIVAESTVAEDLLELAEDVVIELSAEDGEVKFQLPVGEARGGVFLESLRALGGGKSHLFDYLFDTFVGDGESVAHDVSDDDHAEDFVEDLAEVVLWFGQQSTVYFRAKRGLLSGRRFHQGPEPYPCITRTS